MNYFLTLESIILTKEPFLKIERFNNFYNKFLMKKIVFEKDYLLYEINQPSYTNILNIVPPQNINNRKYVNTEKGKINLLHTIAHIEYSAIDLALDAALRYQNMPISYYQDWLEVANDEIRHFLMIENLLKELNAYYGILQVHTNLFEAMKKTPDLLSRMAIVPRYLEANGLEQNPKIMKKLESNKDDFNKKIFSCLKTILEEEVDHVTKGDKWFKYECKRYDLNIEETYLRILENIFPGSTKRKYDLNFEARKKAGFSCNELKYLSKSKKCF